MNKVILMETGETPSLGPSRCSAHLILSFALHLANLYEVHYRNVKVMAKVYKPCLSFFISFSLFLFLTPSVMFPSSSKPLFLHFIDFSTLTVRTYIHVTYETFTKLELTVNLILSLLMTCLM